MTLQVVAHTARQRLDMMCVAARVGPTTRDLKMRRLRDPALSSTVFRAAA
jgi:hypothetical protein